MYLEKGLLPKTLDRINLEMRMAINKHGRGNTPLGDNMDRGQKLAILVEEVGEVARYLCEESLGREQVPEALVQELIQVAAMAAGWAEYEASHDRRRL